MIMLGTIIRGLGNFASTSCIARERARSWSRSGRWKIVLLFVLLMPGLGASQVLVTENPYKVEAAFLRNFARYVTWPSQAFADEHSPWHFCILGGDRFDDVLEKTLSGRTEQGRSFEIFRAETLDQLPSCQIVFVGYKDATKRRAALASLKSLPVLTVGDAPEFLREGGVVRFHVEDHVEISVNLDQARAVSLAIPTKMLEVSREVVENGALRRWR
jgi:hypothetical protein